MCATPTRPPLRVAGSVSTGPPGRARPCRAARTRAAIGRRSAAFFRVPLHAEARTGRRVLDRLDHAVVGPAGDRQRARVGDALVVVAVDPVRRRRRSASRPGCPARTGPRARRRRRGPAGAARGRARRAGAGAACRRRRRRAAACPGRRRAPAGRRRAPRRAAPTRRASRSGRSSVRRVRRLRRTGRARVGAAGQDQPVEHARSTSRRASSGRQHAPPGRRPRVTAPHVRLGQQHRADVVATTPQRGRLDVGRDARCSRPHAASQRGDVGAGDAAVDEERATAVMNDASSLARNATAAAISSGSANRPIGTCTSRRAARSGSLAKSSMQQRRGDRAGAERVDPDALAGELHAQLAGHRQHAALAGGVGDLRGGRAHQRHEATRC